MRPSLKRRLDALEALLPPDADDDARDRLEAKLDNLAPHSTREQAAAFLKRWGSVQAWKAAYFSDNPPVDDGSWRVGGECFAQHLVAALTFPETDA
jgi:hypothetical protein